MAESFVGKPCPKCAYVRRADDSAPEWQCPKCEIVYAKFGQAPPPRKAAVAASTPEDAEWAAASAEPRESINQARLAHLATIGNYLLPPIGTIIPIALWITKSGVDELTVDASKEALNFQLSQFLWALGCFVPMFIFPPLVYISMLALIVLLFAGLALPIVAAIRVSDGITYYYPYTWHLFGGGPPD